MEPQIAFARTRDGVRIAWTSQGDGRALVLMPGVTFGNFLGDWRIPEVRHRPAKVSGR